MTQILTLILVMAIAGVLAYWSIRYLQFKKIQKHLIKEAEAILEQEEIKDRIKRQADALKSPLGIDPKSKRFRNAVFIGACVFAGVYFFDKLRRRK